MHENQLNPLNPLTMNIQYVQGNRYNHPFYRIAGETHPRAMSAPRAPVGDGLASQPDEPEGMYVDYLGFSVI